MKNNRKEMELKQSVAFLTEKLPSALIVSPGDPSLGRGGWMGMFLAFRETYCFALRNNRFQKPKQ